MFKGHVDRYVGSLFRVNEPVPDDSLSAVFLCALCIIANDNARLRTIEEKYVLLRDFSRLDERTSQRADYIEWLYSDEDEHRNEINELWQMRQQRFNNKKQK